MTTALEGGEESASHPCRFSPLEKTKYPLHRRLGGPQGRSGQVRKISPPPGFDPWTVHPIASCYTDYATRPTSVKYTVHLTMQDPVNSSHFQEWNSQFLFPVHCGSLTKPVDKRCCDQVSGTLVSCLRGPQFKSQPKDQLSRGVLQIYSACPSTYENITPSLWTSMQQVNYWSYTLHLLNTSEKMGKHWSSASAIYRLQENL
jgi:hypothetical protein